MILYPYLGYYKPRDTMCQQAGPCVASATLTHLYQEPSFWESGVSSDAHMAWPLPSADSCQNNTSLLSSLPTVKQNSLIAFLKISFPWKSFKIL